jgi:hypothetical protein
VGWHRRFMSADSSPPPTFPTSRAPQTAPVSDAYRSPKRRLVLLRVLLMLTSLLAGVSEAMGVGALQIDDWSRGDGRQAAEAAIVVGQFASLCLVLSYVALALWTSRMYRNLFALGVGDLRFTPAWGLGAWFVPLLNLVRPKQIVDDLWRVSDPAERACSWRQAPVSGIVHVWWATLLLAGLFSPRGGVDALDPASVEAGVVGAVLMILCSACGWFVTSELAARQESLVARRGQLLDSAEASVGPAREALGSLGAVAVCGLAILGAGAGWAVGLPGAAESAPTQDGVRTTRAVDLQIGDCFGVLAPGTTQPWPTETIITVDVVPCDVSHAYELIDVAVHHAPAGADFPGDETLTSYGFEGCGAHFEEIVGVAFTESALDVVVYIPTKDGWLLGDRLIQCVAARVDGGPLEGTVVGSGL